MAVRPVLQAERQAVYRENADLRRALQTPNYTLSEWESLLPQDQRDALAARALIASNGDAFRAANRLGFGHLHRPEAVEILQRLFLTPGCQAILSRDLSEPEQHRKELVARMVRVALYGDDNSAVKAYQMIAKTCGWVGSDVLVQNTKQTILALVTEKNARGEVPAATLEALQSGFLEHEPGSAVRIDSGSELVDAAIGEQ